MRFLRTYLLSVATVVTALPAAAAGFVQTNLVSDLPGVAAVTDPNLVNPWGLASSATSPIWVSDNGTGVSTLYNGAGQPFPIASPLVVTIPPAPGSPTGTTSAPTGVVFNTTSGFGGSHFLFATEDGTIEAWTSGTSAAIAADSSPAGAIYKGLALDGASSRLYATNFHAGTVDVFDTNFSPVNLPSAFTDPTLPSGYAPFGIQILGGLLYVTYAQQDASGEDDVAGPGHGFVDVYDTNGVLIHRLISNGALDSPWGLALAPAGFGSFGGDLLVGNFGDGQINAFDTITGAFQGALQDPLGNPISIEGLWGLRFGNGGNGGNQATLYFAAGIAGPDDIEDHGLFGSLAFAASEPGTLALLGLALCGLGLWRGAKRRSAPS
jgi:uncharacterized protein (TIGR03118 family)